jgi:hypothetical protein
MVTVTPFAVREICLENMLPEVLVPDLPFGLEPRLGLFGCDSIAIAALESLKEKFSNNTKMSIVITVLGWLKDKLLITEGIPRTQI